MHYNQVREAVKPGVIRLPPCIRQEVQQLVIARQVVV
jgi:hypothetical protein